MVKSAASGKVVVMNIIRECLATNLKIRRAVMRISQEELAELTGLSAGFIANMETGRSWPSPETLLKLSVALNVDHWNLLIDPKKDEIPYSKADLSILLDRVKSYILGDLPPSYVASRQLLNDKDDTDGKRR